MVVHVFWSHRRRPSSHTSTYIHDYILIHTYIHTYIHTGPLVRSATSAPSLRRTPLPTPAWKALPMHHTLPYIHTYIHSIRVHYIHTYIHTIRVRTHIHTRLLLHIYIINTNILPYLHTYLHMYIHIYIDHVYIHTYIHTYIHSLIEPP